MKKFETAIIGAGPAGSTAASLLAEQGREVVLLDRCSFPRHKVCGGGIPARTSRILNCDYSSVIENTISTVNLVGGWAKSLTVAAVNMAHIVNRTDFDYLLLKHALKMNVEFYENHDISSIEKTKSCWKISFRGKGDFQIEANNIIVAAGAIINFNVHPQLEPIPQGIALEGFSKIPESASSQNRQTAIFDFTCINGGYGWVFPRKNVYAVGIGTSKWKTPDIKRRLVKLCDNLNCVLENELTDISGAALPFFHKPLKRYAFDNLYLTGDSAGLVDPLTGEGIFFAVQSGVFAAEAVLNGAEAKYNNLLNQDIIPELCVAYRYARKATLVPKWLLRIVMSSGRYKKYAEKFVAIMAAKTTYREMYKDMHNGREFIY
ncbi:MAG: NAD(P)/FAD-dependent oxidoreductase [Planctomycetota bacterium]|jgi:geranylgeranyl reductase family protein